MRVWVLERVESTDYNTRYGVFSSPGESLTDPHSGWLTDLYRMTASGGLQFGVDEDTARIWFESPGGDRIEMTPEKVIGYGIPEIEPVTAQVVMRMARSWLFAVLSRLDVIDASSMPDTDELTGRWRIIRDDGPDNGEIPL